MLKLVTYHEITSTENSKQIESLISSKTYPESLSNKRKIEQHVSRASSPKRSKFDDVDKENPNKSKPFLRKRVSNNREPLSSIQNTNVTLRKASLVEDAAKENSFSSSNLHLLIIEDYEPRVSLECCLNLINLTQKTQSLNDNKLTKDTNKKNELILLITNASMNDYIMRILERKLKSTVNADQEKSLYDIHSNEHRDTFEIISAIWKWVYFKSSRTNFNHY